MAIAEIKRAAERRLNSTSGEITTAFEGVPFSPPTGLYQRCAFLIRPATDPTYGTGYHRENIQMQVWIIAPLGKGTGDAIARAEVIRERFKKGTYMEESGVFIHVLGTPQITGTSVTNDRVVCGVLVDFTAEVSS